MRTRFSGAYFSSFPHGWPVVNGSFSRTTTDSCTETFCPGSGCVTRALGLPNGGIEPNLRIRVWVLVSHLRRGNHSAIIHSRDSDWWACASGSGTGQDGGYSSPRHDATSMFNPASRLSPIIQRKVIRASCDSSGG